MTTVWVWVTLTALITFITLCVDILYSLWKRRAWNKQRAVNIERDNVWTALTKADRQWFQANLWDGKTVLDEPVVPDEPKPLRVIDCKHANTVSETSIQDAGVRLICMDCGLTWVEDWDTWIED